MAFDGLVLHALSNELKACVHGRINKIYQPNDHDIVMHLRTKAGNVKLLLSANPTYPRMHLTDRQYTNPQDAPMFCMLLRKHCENGVIDGIGQVGMERIMRIQLRQRDELGDIRKKAIIVELMGRHSNIILLDDTENKILDGIHHVTPAISQYRVVMPGSVYVAPPDQGKSDPFAVTEASFRDTIREHLANAKTEQTSLHRLFVAALSGISPLAAKEIVHRAGVADAAGNLGDAQLAKLWAAFSAVMDQIRQGRIEPNIVDTVSGKADFSVIALTHLAGSVRAFPDVSAMLEAFYGEKAERDAVKQKVADLAKMLQNEIAKNDLKLVKLAETLKEAQEADRFRIMGELVTANMHAIKRGDEQLQAVNYYEETQPVISIPLEPRLTPSENAQRYFKKYTKAKNSIAAIREQMELAQTENRYLKTVRQQLEFAALADVEEIREELTEQGYVRRKAERARKTKPGKQVPKITCFTSSEGIPIYVGKNNIQNEYVTHRLAKANETWLHAKDIPGAHVVIKSNSFGERTLIEAAELAAFFSQGRQSSRVPVDATLIKHVRKPNGAKPGFVIYDHQKTLFVTPDEQRIKAMPNNII
ncbi:MAG TPA: NFACT RNA binding domain-containing protein [Bacilli bacterium]